MFQGTYYYQFITIRIAVTSFENVIIRRLRLRFCNRPKSQYHTVSKITISSTSQLQTTYTRRFSRRLNIHSHTYKTCKNSVFLVQKQPTSCVSYLSPYIYFLHFYKIDVINNKFVHINFVFLRQKLVIGFVIKFLLFEPLRS